jgi:flagellar hook-associated protein 1 FlgK
MGNLLTSVLNAAKAIQAYDRQLATIQSNVANASTPGYVRQTQTLEAMRFDLRSGLAGGVAAGPVLSSRSEYAEESVRRQFSQQGYSEQLASDLGRLESIFSPSGNYGTAASITKFFQSFSQLSINPNDTVARQAVIDRSQDLATSFNQTALGLADASQQADQQIRASVIAVNRLGQAIQEINTVYRQSAQSNADAGLDASVYSKLEELSELVDFTINRAEDGTLSIYLGGQTPLVIGDHLFEISAEAGSQFTAVIDATGRDVTGQIHHGKLSGLLHEKNTLIPSYLADLDQLAQAMADQVNLKLAGGVDAYGAAPVIDLFEYNAAQGAAMSLGVTAITPQEIAASTADAPGGNGNALDVAAMLNQKLIDGFTFTERFGTLGGRVGRDLASAREDAATQELLAIQARTFRSEISGVSLDEEAAYLLQVQRSYQAASKLMAVLNEITDTLMQTLR